MKINENNKLQTVLQHVIAQRNNKIAKRMTLVKLQTKGSSLQSSKAALETKISEDSSQYF